MKMETNEQWKGFHDSICNAYNNAVETNKRALPNAVIAALTQSTDLIKRIAYRGVEPALDIIWNVPDADRNFPEIKQLHTLMCKQNVDVIEFSGFTIEAINERTRCGIRISWLKKEDADVAVP